MWGSNNAKQGAPRRRGSWMAIGILLLMNSTTVCAFLTSPGARLSPRFIIPNNRGRLAPLSLASNNDSSETDRTKADAIADSIRRRQLLFSLLAASGTTVAGPGLVKAEDAAVSDIPATKAVANVHIMKPPLDDRDYETYILDNGLRVLLCSDPSSNEAAAAMDVHVGACSDPDDVPGLAHFCEHMLFLGTEKYPIEDSFETFLSSNGGSSNAFTDNENTVRLVYEESCTSSEYYCPSYTKGLLCFCIHRYTFLT